MKKRALSRVNEEQMKLAKSRESSRRSRDTMESKAEDLEHLLRAPLPEIPRKSFIESVREILEDPEGYVESRSYRNLTGML